MNVSGCPFCPPKVTKLVTAIHGSVFAILDKYPVTPGHTLVICQRHTQDYFTITSQERRDADALLMKLQAEIRQSDSTVVGFNIGMNCGEVAGQTIMHAHMHVIPRRQGDTENPFGGIRCVIPAQKAYESAETLR